MDATWITLTSSRRRAAIAGTALLIAATGACAAREIPDACARSPNESALQGCRQKHADQSAAQVDRALTKLQTRLEKDEPARWKLLATSQTAWRDYQQAECRFRTFESSSGKGFQSYWLSCLTELSQIRLRDLQKFVNNP